VESEDESKETHIFVISLLYVKIKLFAKLYEMDKNVRKQAYSLEK
jgi:hypothetical protein